MGVAVGQQQSTTAECERETIVPGSAGGRTPYVVPAITRREPLAGMLQLPTSDLPPRDTAGSDREIKANVVPVDWTRGRKS
ncbi:MAG: hypothetical protein AMXMBFR46_11510 [Acidimicrobiia bacterium]